MPRRFTIRILVAEGVPDGLRFVEKSNWVGLGVVCPRSRYAEVRGRDEFQQSGVYILVGREASGDQPTVYIGEGDTLRPRLDSHHAKKDFWQQVVAFTTKGDPLNKAEVQYLEAALVERARRHRRCRLDNSVVPQFPRMSEADEAQVEGYLEELLSLLPIIGLEMFQAPAAGEEHTDVLTWSGTGWSAEGIVTSSGFLVRQGSHARGEVVDSLERYAPGYLRTRDRLIEDGLLVPDGDSLRFTDDHLFSSPSEAATVISGRNSNGRTCWKDASGATLKERQEREAGVDG